MRGFYLFYSLTYLFKIVSKGSKVAADNILFSVDETMSVPESGYVELTATCTTAGSIGNVKAGEINRFPVTLPGLTAVENITDFTGGYDAESDADLLERYLEKVSTMTTLTVPAPFQRGITRTSPTPTTSFAHSI